MSAKKDIETFEAIGRRAFAAGEPAAPVLNSEVIAAIEGMAVGAGAIEIFEAFARGWTSARDSHTTITVTCNYADGDTVTTRFNGTADDARAYFVGQTFNIGSVDDNMQRCVSITIHDTATESRSA